MSFYKSNKLLIILFISLFCLAKSQKVVIVYAIDNNIKQNCDKNVYYFEFPVRFSEKFDKLIPFEMNIPLPNNLPFKCAIDGPNTKIQCFHSFDNYVWSLSDNTRVELPYSFPNIEGIRWDYDSFLRTIYRYLWRTNGNCGLEFESMKVEETISNQISKDSNNNNEKKFDIIGNIEEIYNGKCHSSKNDYSFEMQVQLNDGSIIDELKSTKSLSKNMAINILDDIYLPVLLGEKRQKGITSFRKDYDYKYASCKYRADITQDNFNISEGIILECHLPVNRYNRFQGPLQIKPFTDYVYISQIDKDGKTNVKMIGIQLDILSSSSSETTDEEIEDSDEKVEDKKTEINNNEALVEETNEIKEEEKNGDNPKEEGPKETKVEETAAEKKEETRPNEKAVEITATEEKKPEESKRNLRNLITKKEPNFLILDSNLNVFICPDKPILTIKNYEEGFGFGGLNTSGSKYLFLIYGYLSNGYDFINETLTLLEMTKDEIKFYLKVTDNLEDPDNKKKSVKCSIPTGTSINRNVLIEVKCIGHRAKLGNNNTDLVLNWNLEENNNFENIVVKWPYDLTKKKHIFYYNVEGLSIKKNDYGCFENKYYFYLYVYDLKSEPKISFNLPLVYPKNTHAECKLYNSVTFKCVIDLRLKRLSKGGKVILSNDINEYLANNEQNLVLYHVNNNTSSSYLDFMLPVEEDCGNFILIGALKEVGYTYLQTIIIIISCIIGILLSLFAITFCIVYEITHRNRKGQYFRHTEEKKLPNTSVFQTKPPV